MQTGKITKIQLKDLKPNPFRDLRIDPIQPKPEIRQSIEAHGFWSGVTVRKDPSGDGYQIAAGHTRVAEALAVGITEVELHVADHNDDDMVRVYAVENATQRGADSSAIAGSVAAALRLLIRREVKSVDADRLSAGDGGPGFSPASGRGSGQFAAGIGADRIRNILRSNNANFAESAIKSHLENLKASGDYNCIINEELTEAERFNLLRIKEAKQEVLAQAEAEQKAAEAAAEAEEAKREAIRRSIEASTVREVEAKRRATEVAAKAEEEKLQAEDRAREAEAAAIKIKDERETKVSTSDKTAEVIAKLRSVPVHEPVFDLAGVTKHLKLTAHVDTFRKKVESEGTAKFLPVSDQAALAEKIVALAKSTPGQELTSSFILNTINSMLYSVRASDNTEREHHEREMFARMAWTEKAQKLESELEKHITGIHVAAHDWGKHYTDASAEPDLFSVKNLKSKLQRARNALDKILDLVSERSSSPVIDSHATDQNQALLSRSESDSNGTKE